MGKKKSRLGFSQVITISWFSKLKFLGRSRTPPATTNQAKKSTPMVDISVPDCSRTFRGSSANDFCVSTISNLSFSPRILDRRIGRRQSGIEESGDGFRRLSLDQCFERENFGDFLEYLRHQPDEFDFARSSCGSCRSSISSVAKMVGNESDCEVSVAGKTKITETVPKPRKFSDMLSDIKKTHDHAGKFNISPKNEPETLTLGSKRFSERRKTRSFDDFVPRTAGFEIPRRRTTDRVTSKTDRENNENEQSISPQESRKKDLNSRNQEQKVTDLLSGNADRRTERKNHKFTYRDSAKENRRTSQEDHESRTLYPKERDRITSKQSHKSTASLSRKPDRRTARDKNETNNRLPTSEIQSKGTSKSVNKKKEQQRKIKQGNKIKVYSPSPASKIEFWREKTTQNQELQRRETKKKNGGVAESFAVTKRSFDPQKDFRESMVEMIAENRIGRPDELEDLLASYLCLNSDEYHDLIVKVFRQTDKLLARGNMEGGRSVWPCLGTVLPQFPIQFHRRTFQTWHRRLDHSVSNRLRTLQSAFYTSFSSEIGTRSAFVKAVSLADIVNFWFLSSNKRVD